MSLDSRRFQRCKMQAGNLSSSFVVICMWVVISGTLAKAVDNMEEQTAASEKRIRQGQGLCAGEQEFVHKRKEIVLESLKSLGINCTADSVPHIVFLGSGGGQRAAVGLVGSLYQMEKDGLLDTLLYMSGVSGSTWAMSSLYSDPQWSVGMARAVTRLSGPGVGLGEALAWLGERAKEEHFSLTDIMGVLTAAGIMKQMDLRHLSDEASRNATNPYPIYGAIEKQCFVEGPLKGKWFEVSPHEAGFTELGLFVETSLLGSKFRSGELLEEKPEMDMVKLQGILGSALAQEDTVRENLPAWLNNPQHIVDPAEEHLRVYKSFDKLVTLVRGIVQDEAALSYLDNLQKIMKDVVKQNESAWLESQSLEERQSLSQQCSQKLLEAVDTWTQSLPDSAFKTHVSVLTKQVIPLIMKWEWGTTNNFLYQYQDSTVPACLLSNETFHLMDAGMLINAGYPSFMGDKRDIDLIIAPEYSAGDMFEPLTLARDYAAELEKPFPEIDNQTLEERDWPKDCYVFEGRDKEPTIVYMPLFNRQNCKDAQQVKARMEEFGTFQLPYNHEKIEFMLETAKANMRNNKETLLREIKKAVLRRHNKGV